MRTMVLLFALVVPVVAQEQTRPAYWGAGGQMPAAKPVREDAHRRALRQYDTNKDGRLDAEERKAMLRDRKSAASR